jgi:hypothetical protein
MEEKCASAAICFVSFLPDILDSKAEGRNKYLELLLSVAEKFKKSPYRQVSAELITNFTEMCLSFITFKEGETDNSLINTVFSLAPLQR